MEEARAFAPLTAQRIADFAKPSKELCVSDVFKFGMNLFVVAQHKPVIYWTALDEKDCAQDAYGFCGKYDINSKYSEMIQCGQPGYTGDVWIDSKGVLIPSNENPNIPEVKPTAVGNEEYFMLTYLKLLFHGQSSHFTSPFKVDSLNRVNDLATLVRQAMPLHDTEVNFLKDLDGNKWLYASYTDKEDERCIFHYPRCMINVNFSFLE